MISPRQFYNFYISPEKSFVQEVAGISGYIPREVFLYHLALTHSSSLNTPKQTAESAKYCNERLEFLGDSILDAVIADYLFKIYPLRDEGFLTEMRSKIVNRKSLNDICKQLRLDVMIQHNQGGSGNESMYGDALEAFIGALYVDLGFTKTKRFILNKIIGALIQLDNVEEQVISYKNKLIEHTQKHKMGQLEFEVRDEQGIGHHKTFVIQARVGNKILGVGMGRNKKTAEQNASLDALQKMKILTNGKNESTE